MYPYAAKIQKQEDICIKKISFVRKINLLDGSEKDLPVQFLFNKRKPVNQITKNQGNM